MSSYDMFKKMSVNRLKIFFMCSTADHATTNREKYFMTRQMIIKRVLNCSNVLCIEI